MVGIFFIRGSEGRFSVFVYFEIDKCFDESWKWVNDGFIKRGLDKENFFFLFKGKLKVVLERINYIVYYAV